MGTTIYIALALLAMVGAGAWVFKPRRATNRHVKRRRRSLARVEARPEVSKDSSAKTPKQDQPEEIPWALEEREDLAPALAPVNRVETVSVKQVEVEKESVPQIQAQKQRDESISNEAVAAACDLGAGFIYDYAELGYHLPDSQKLISAEALNAAHTRLRERSPDLRFAHGAIGVLLGQRAGLLIEPLVASVRVPEQYAGELRRSFGDRRVYLLHGCADGSDGTLTAHIRAVVKALDISPRHFFFFEPDGTSITCEEDQLNYAPARLDAANLPESFVDEMLSYAQARLNEGEPEAALRTLGPLAGPLWQRVVKHGGFDMMLLARVLNLLGAANRNVGSIDEASACFESALKLLKSAEDFESVQIVESNLGVTLLRRSNGNAELLLRASKHLKAAVQLDPDDTRSLRALADTYLTRYEVERSISLLSRAEHAYRQVAQMAPSEEVVALIDKVAKLKSLRRSAELPRARPTLKALHPGC